MRQNILLSIVLWMLMLCAGAVQAKSLAVQKLSTLQELTVDTTEKDAVKLVLIFSSKIASPKHFMQNGPVKAIWDFANIKNNIAKDLMNRTIEYGSVQAIHLVETEERLRLIADANDVIHAETIIEDNKVIITLTTEKKSSLEVTNLNAASPLFVQNIDFRRGQKGEARIVVNLNDNNEGVDFYEEANKIVARFYDVKLPEHLKIKYDVLDFGTAVESFVASQVGKDVILTINPLHEFDKIAYQIDKQFVIEVKALSKEEKDALQQSRFQYTGERLSFNFQDIEVRAILQLLADFTGLNIISSDTVKGNITLRLQNVPWDQALDIIMKSKGLAKRQEGNVLLVGPQTEIVASEKQSLESSKQVAELTPLKTELIQISYASVEDIANLLKENDNSVLSTRGAVTIDKRTNTLIVQDMASKIAEIRSLIKKLDKQMPQVEIETQIVSISDSFQDAFGTRFGGALNQQFGHRNLGVGGRGDIARYIVENNASGIPGRPNTTLAPITGLTLGAPGPGTNNVESLFSDLGIASGSLTPSGMLGFALAGLPRGTLLDLELQALESESKGKVLARPKLRTTDQTKARVEQGVQIPYTSQAGGTAGGSVVSFVTAALILEVTPHITPDDNVILDLEVNKDTEGLTATGNTAPNINTNRLKTQVLVSNGDTVVLGGAFTLNTTRAVTKVPFFGDLPLLGFLFKNRNLTTDKDELLIFVTPKIVNTILPTG